LLRLLRDSSVKKPQAIGFEALSTKEIVLLKAWLKQLGPKSEDRLRDSLNLEDRFGSSFETYKEIFLSCAKYKIDILPLRKSDKDLWRRDEAVSKTIANCRKKLWILFGEYHCARPHLPHLVQKLRPSARLLVIQQNDDRASLKRLTQPNVPKTLILKSARKRFGISLYCVLHTPLWVKYQSYLEKHLQASDEDEREALDASDQITWSLRTLSQFLNDPRYPHRISEKDLLDFTVLTAEDSNFFKSLSRFSKAEKSLVLSQIRSSGVAVLPDRRFIYLSELTVNSCAQTAGLYLYLLWSGSRYSKQDFFKRSLSESMGFLLSKLLNHSRRATPWKKWVHLARTSSKKREAEAVLRSQTFVENFALREKWFKKLKPFQDQAAVALGRNLADAIFEAFLAGEFSQSRLIRLLKTKVRDELQAYQILVELKSVGSSFSIGSRKGW
jgi:hypothetical protein